MAKKDVALTHARLKELVAYDPETGEFTYNVHRFRRQAGSRAGWVNARGHGYVVIVLDGRSYLGHRLAWFFMIGAWPSEQVDHINRDRADNRWVNLREASASQNQANRHYQRAHQLPRGVRAIGNRFASRITGTHLGVFDTPEEAHSVYLTEARRKFGEYFPG